jgi:aspartate beta-hydroxylase
MHSVPGMSSEARRRYAGLIDALIRDGRSDLADQCARLAVAQGVWDNAQQRPLDYVPGVSAQPVYEPSQFWFVHHLEANYDKIRDEIDAVTDPSRHGFRPVDEPLLGSGRWDQVVFYEAGRRQDAACYLFPVLTDVIDQVPEATTLGPGVVTLSWLHPGTHVIPHCGQTNAQLRVHLGLRVPPGVSIRVGDQHLTWQEGKCIVFDDSFEHEVWHRGTQPRVVLLLDVAHPGLREHQRRALLARRRTASQQVASYMADHGLRRAETDGGGIVMRPAARIESLVRRYMAETGATAVELGADGLRFERPPGSPEGSRRLAEMERQIAEVWADVLGTERVGPTDDFFELGGNSLHAVQIVIRTEEIVGVSLSSRSVLESRNVHEMAAHVWRVRDAANDSAS